MTEDSRWPGTDGTKRLMRALHDLSLGRDHVCNSAASRQFGFHRYFISDIRFLEITFQLMEGGFLTDQEKSPGFCQKQGFQLDLSQFLIFFFF
jgi:hypothetical protein